ncbi:MAG: hypothetical protein KDC70_02260 [Saprospiraceae bacterium]|nr:hypothetical protein [Saprospiraceae bacterium]
MITNPDTFFKRLKRNARENAEWLVELWNNQDRERDKLLRYYRWHFKELVLCVLLAYLLTRVDKVQQFFSAFAIEIKRGHHEFLHFALVFGLNGLVVFWLCYVFWHKPARVRARFIFGDRRREDFEAYYRKPGGAWRVAMVSALPMLLVNVTLSMALLRDYELLGERPSPLSEWLDSNAFYVQIIVAALYLALGSLIRPRYRAVQNIIGTGNRKEIHLTASQYDAMLGSLWKTFIVNLLLLPAGILILTILLWFYHTPAFQSFQYITLLFFVLAPPLTVAFFLSSFSECLIIERRKEDQYKEEELPFEQKFEKWYNWLMGTSYVISILIFLLCNSSWITRQEWFSQWMFPIAMLLFIFIAYYQALDLLTYNTTRVRFYLFSLFCITVLIIWGRSDHYRMKFDSATPHHRSPKRTNLETYYLNWAKDRFLQGEPAEAYLAAAEGGGSRSGAWTCAVLTQLDMASQGAFRRHCFAISGVSGGAVGSAATIALWDHASKLQVDSPLYNPAKRDKYIERIFRRNYISTALAGIFFYDLIQQFPLLNNFYPEHNSRTDRHQDEEDNAVCLSLCDMFGEQTLLREHYLKKTDFLSLYYEQDSVAPRTDLPLFFPNTCRVEDGRRGILSPILIDKSDKGRDRKSPFSTTIVDIVGICDSLSPSLGEATSLSELFPYVNAPVFINKNTGSFMDGGAYENLGLTTLYEVKQSLDVICEHPDSNWIATNLPEKQQEGFRQYLRDMRFKILLIYNIDNHGYEMLAEYKNYSIKLFDPIMAMLQTPFGGHTDYIYHKVKFEMGDSSVIDFPLLETKFDTTRTEKIVMSRWLSELELDTILQRSVSRVDAKLGKVNKRWLQKAQ